LIILSPSLYNVIKHFFPLSGSFESEDSKKH